VTENSKKWMKASQAKHWA